MGGFCTLVLEANYYFCSISLAGPQAYGWEIAELCA